VSPAPRAWVKVCGVTGVADAELAAEAGADAIGLNLWPRSPRGIGFETAAAIAAAVRGRLEVVTVSVDPDRAHLATIVERIAPDRLQIHGLAPDLAAGVELPAGLYVAVGLRDPADVERALEAPGEIVLVDARDDVQRGGTGRAPPAELAVRVCRARATIVAGGLGPDNVAAAIRALRPAGVDAASGLEHHPGRKDPERVRAFVRQARRAFEEVGNA
jgi:phosphoribosylanthranilate isomerase